MSLLPRVAVATIATLASIPTAALAQDADGDGVADGLDALPCDRSAAAVSFAPAEGVHGSLLFEDLWPEELTDLDFNDVHVTYNYVYRRDAQGRVTSMRAQYDVLAIGGRLDNGLGLHLPVPRGSLATARRTIAGVTTELVASGADAELTIQLSPDLRELFGLRAGQINSVREELPEPAGTMIVDITFATPVTLSAASAPHDVYITRGDEIGHEIHRPEFGGTAAMNQALFGTGADGSTANRRFVDIDGLPYALAFGTLVQYPREAAPISLLYPNIVAFAASGGTTNRDFYQTNVDASWAYAPNSGAAATPAPINTAVDRSCVPANRSSCRNILLAGMSRGSGRYDIDVDGTGPLAPINVYCDMTTDGGGWTLVEWIIGGYHATTAAVNSAALPARTTHAKLADATIRSIAAIGAGEALIDGTLHQNTRYIFRYSAAEWTQFASNGWTNVAYDSKNAAGTWVNNVCNGHYNNRGFSSYSDAHGSPCPVVFTGTARYINTWHTYDYAGGIGGTYGVLLR